MWMTNLTVTSMTNSSITNSPTEFYNLFAEITNGLLQPNSTSSESATSISLSMPTTKPVYPMIEINISIDQYRETRNPCVGIHLESPTEQIPLVYIILNYKLSFILKTIPFICQFHDKIVLLTNSQFDSFWKSTCVEVVDISNLYDIADKEFNFPPGAAHGQKIFFTRWYVLRRWMDATGTNQIFTLDSDGLIFRNITSLVRANADVFCRSALWLIYQPPRTSMQFFLITLPALADVTDFWKRMLQPDIWSSEYVEGTSPNDMIAMGHYIHAAIGRPYPCWGLNRENPAYLSSPGTCDNYNAYAWTKILDRLSEKKVLAAFKPETLTLYPNGSPNGSMGGGLPGAVDHNFEHDDVGTYQMIENPRSRTGRYKAIRYRGGEPQMQLVSGEWGGLFGLVLEDSLEECVDNHIRHVNARADCGCSDGPCCATC